MIRYTTCLLVMLLLASCGEESAQPAKTTAAETTAAPVETSILDELGAKDFAGRTFTILDANDDPATHINMPGEEMNGDAEFTGFIPEAMARESHIGIRPKVYELTLKGKSARDEGSSEMIDYIFNSLYIDHLGINNFGGLAAALGDVVLRGQPLASTVASYQKAANSAISDFTEAWTQK